MPEGTFVSRIVFAYNAEKITYIKASTEENFAFERGLQEETDEVFEVFFEEF